MTSYGNSNNSDGGDGGRNDLGDWLEGFLFDRRIAVVRGALDDGLATRVATELMTLDATGDAAVTLQIDSQGGTLSAALTLVDVIETLGVPVNVVCLGRVEGTAVVVAAAGSHRSGLPHTRFRLGDPDVSFDGPASAIEQMAADHRRSLGRYHECLARFSGQPVATVAVWCAEGSYLDATEAVELGLLDEIAKGKSPLRPLR